MTKPEGGTGSGSHDEVLAGEYVLGALPPDMALKVEARLRRDRQFAAIVRRWQENLAALEEGEEEEPWMLMQRGRLSGGGAPLAGRFAAPPRSLWHSLAFWRGFGVAALALAVLYTLFEAGAVGHAPQPPAPRTAEATGTGPSLSYDPAAARVTLAPADGPWASAELWLIDAAGTARSIGLMPPEGRVTLSPEMSRLMEEGAVLALSPALGD